jgi:hypothetical protein
VIAVLEVAKDVLVQLLLGIAILGVLLDDAFGQLVVFSLDNVKTLSEVERLQIVGGKRAGEEEA